MSRDAASAAIVGGSPRRSERPLGQVLLTRSLMIPDTIDYVRIKDCDDATISWYNSKNLPEKICENVSIYSITTSNTTKTPSATTHTMPLSLNLTVVLTQCAMLCPVPT